LPIPSLLWKKRNAERTEFLVLPVTLEDIQLCAELEDGYVITGEADVIVLLVDGVCDAIKKSKALKIYVCNVKALERHSFEGIVDYCIFNTADIPELLKNDYDELDKLGIKLLGGDFVCITNGYIRHDTKKLAQAIMNLVIENVFGKDDRKSSG